MLKLAQDEHDPLSALGEGAPHADETICGSKAYCDELLALPCDGEAATRPPQVQPMKRVRKSALATVLQGGPAPCDECHREEAQALRLRLLRWRSAPGMDIEAIENEANDRHGSRHVHLCGDRRCEARLREVSDVPRVLRDRT